MALRQHLAILWLAAAQTVCLLVPCPGAAQRPGASSQSNRDTLSATSAATADLVVTLHDEKNAEFQQPAKVTLRNSNRELRGATVVEKGRAIFRAVALDTYEITVEVQGQGYSTSHASVSLEQAGETRTLDIIVQSGSSTPASAGPPLPPPLSLREQKELTTGLRALQAQKLEEARKHFLSAAKTAPNHPDVDYLLGVLATMTGDVVAAKQYFENAAKLYQHARSLSALGEIYLVEGNLPQAKTCLENALHADPNSWRANQLMAAVALRQHSYSDAIQLAEHALQLGKIEAQGARLTLAEALSASGDHSRSVQVLNELLKRNPTEEQVKEANQLLAANRAALAPTSPSASVSRASASVAPEIVVDSLPALPLAASLPAPSDNPLTEHARWTPPNVDDMVPPAETSASCPLPQLLDQAGHRVLELVENLDRFTATENLNHQSLNEFGLAVHAEQRRFNYLVTISEVRPGIFDVSEYRDGTRSQDVFPEHLATLGTFALVFVFHPNYASDFEFKCEGQTHQGNQLAWQVHFTQKPERSSRIRSYRLGLQYQRVSIKGRAWISASSFQVLRLESDLVRPVPEIRLHADHQDITYGPIPFQKKHLVLWLPHSADTYLDFNGHRIHRRQDLSNYLLFWVDDSQHIEKPKETQAPQASTPSG